MVQANVGQKATPLTSSHGYVALHFLHTKTMTEESQVARLHKKHKKPCKNHHHGGRAVRSSSGVDLTEGWAALCIPFPRPLLKSLAIID
jgi:hypothetical protein